MRKEIGEEKAKEIMKRAIYRRGLDVGQSLAEYGPNDLEGLKNAFLTKIVPGEDGGMFQPKVLHCDDEKLDIQLQKCPLKEAYGDIGLSDEEKATMLEIASHVDYGTFEGAGFKFSAESWKPGREGCCRLQVRKGE